VGGGRVGGGAGKACMGRKQNGRNAGKQGGLLGVNSRSKQKQKFLSGSSLDRRP